MAAGAVEVNVTTNNSKAGAMFDGVDDVVTISEINSVDKSSPFSISLNFIGRELEQDVEDRAILHHSKATDNRIGIIVKGGVVKTGIYNGATYFLKISSTGLTNNKWYNVVVTYNGVDDMKMFLDNELQAGTSSPGLGAAGFGFGGNGVDANRYYSGGVSNVQVWNRVLTTDEITKVYQGSSVTEGLIHRWKLDSVDPAGNYPDSVGSNDGTNNGSYLSIQDDTIAAAIKADRTTANDKYLMVGMPGGQVVSAVIEEAP